MAKFVHDKVAQYGTSLWLLLKTPKGRYEWLSYIKAIILWLVISLLIMGIIVLLMNLQEESASSEVPLIQFI